MLRVSGQRRGKPACSTNVGREGRLLAAHPLMAAALALTFVHALASHLLCGSGLYTSHSVLHCVPLAMFSSGALKSELSAARLLLLSTTSTSDVLQALPTVHTARPINTNGPYIEHVEYIGCVDTIAAAAPFFIALLHALQCFGR